MITVYTYFIYPILEALFFAFALINKKANNTRKERIYQNLEQFHISDSKINNSKIFLIHAASVGEFEQAKPIIEKIKYEIPESVIVATFFSISGYTQQKNYPLLDFAFFLPQDTRTKTKAFLEKIKPDLILIMRYDLWFQFLTQAKKMNIPVILANATLLHNSKKFIPFIKIFFRKLYTLTNAIFCVSGTDYVAFQKLLGENNYTLANIKTKQLKDQTDNSKTKLIIAGDTRYDRVIAKANFLKNISINNSSIENISAEHNAVDEIIIQKNNLNNLVNGALNNYSIIVAGSTWKPDEILLSALFELSRNDIKSKKILLIIVPHEPIAGNVNFIRNIFPNAQITNRLSVKNFEEIISNAETNNQLINSMIVAQTGVLAGLYEIADMAYVGGGFGSGVHSTLEPAVFGLPIISGKNIIRSQDACYLYSGGVLRTIENKSDLKNVVVNYINDDTHRYNISQKARKMVLEKAGATEFIFTECKNFLN